MNINVYKNTPQKKAKTRKRAKNLTWESALYTVSIGVANFFLINSVMDIIYMVMRVSLKIGQVEISEAIYDNIPNDGIWISAGIATLIFAKLLKRYLT